MESPEDFGRVIGILIGYGLLLLLGYGFYRLGRRIARKRAFRDLHLWAAWAIPLLGWYFTAMTLTFVDHITPPLGPKVRFSHLQRIGHDAGIGPYSGRDVPIAPSSVPLLYDHLTAFDMMMLVWIGLAVVLSWRARKVRVVVFRSFHTEADLVLEDALKRVLAFIGRVDALQSHQSRVWAMFAKHKGEVWKDAALKMLRTARLAVIDVSQVTDNLEWEIAEVRKRPKIRVVYVASESAVVREDLHPVVRYRQSVDRAFVESLLNQVAAVSPRHRVRWRMPRPWLIWRYPPAAAIA
ncbi:MAG: hypothetical protein ACK4WH_12630 [Phycisphaerales bacterium]